MMEIIIIAIIIYFVVRHFKKNKNEKPAKVFEVGDPSALPNDLKELRKMRDKTSKDEVKFQCRRKICELGMQLYKDGYIVSDPASDYDVSKLLSEMYNLIDDMHTYVYYQVDYAFEFRCLQTGCEMSEKLNPPMQGDVFKFTEYAWSHLADFYAEGKVCPRNPGLARKYYRMRIMYDARMKDMITSPIASLMEVPQEGEDGRQEILKFIALMYGYGALKIASGKTYRNCFAQTHQQAAELLFQMDWGRIGSADINTMLDEYTIGAQAGNAYAQYKLGMFYLDGRYVAKDEARGLDLLEQAAAQDLYVAVDALSSYYYRLAYPYAGDYNGASKEQIQSYEATYNKWSKQNDIVLAKVEQQYANSFTGYINNSGNIPTSGTATTASVAPSSSPEPANEEEYEGRMGKDSESPFTVMDLPDVVTGPYNVTYRKTSVSSNSADYWGDNGCSATIHLSDIGISGRDAMTVDGYFYW